VNWFRRAIGTNPRKDRDAAVYWFLVLFAVLFPLFAIVISGGSPSFWLSFMADGGVYMLLALGLNVVVGFAGLLDLGYAAFFAIGAYTYAFLASNHLEVTPLQTSAHVPFWIVLFVALFVAAAFGVMLGAPTLRLRGDYLAIVTLGFGEIIRVLILNIDKIGGARGLSGIPPWSNFFWVYFFVGVTILVSWRLVQSSVGRAFLAVREDQVAAEAMGVNTTKYKVKAFVIGSFLAGVSGGLFAHYMMYLNPTMFMFIKSFEVVAMVVLGGLGSISGSVIAAIILTFLPEGLRMAKEVLHMSKDPRMVIYSIMLIVLMLTRPQGLLGRRELWQALPKRKDKAPKEDKGEDAPPVQ
jgi:branched-chain amino acid transport system permease protein